MTKRKRRHRRSVDVRINWLQPHADSFKDWLARRNYSLATITEVVRLLALWGDWVRAAGFEVDTLAAGFAASASVFRGSKTARAPQGAAVAVHHPFAPDERPSAGAAVRRWRRLGRHSPPSVVGCGSSAASRTPRSILIRRSWSICWRRSAPIQRLIRPPQSVASCSIVRRPHGRGRAQGITVATRAYLKYLVAIGQCPVGREHAVPSFASWQLATTPRFLGQADIDRLLAACDREDRLRDRAVVLLLARLGMRASEVANLAFDELDWVAGRITLAGKARREERLPLTQEIGDAIIAYIERARPRIATTRLFLTSAAPIRPLSRIAVKCIVRRALDRAGIKSAHRGAHILRHSAATAMLRNGASSCRCRRRVAASFAVGHGALCQGRHWPPVGDRAALGREAAMLNDDVNRYITLRRTLGYKLVKAERHLRAFARFAAERGETHIRTASVLAWIETVARTPGARAAAPDGPHPVRALPSCRRSSA